MADGAIDSLSIEIGASSADAIQSIKSLATALKNLKNGLKDLDVSKLSQELQKLGKSDFSKLAKLGESLKGLKGATLNKNLPTTMTNLVNALDQVQTRHINRLKRLGEALGTLQGNKISIGKNLPDQLKNIGAAVSEITDDTIKKLDEMTKAIDRLRGIDLRGFASAVKAMKREAGALANVSEGAVATSNALVPVGGAPSDKELLDMIQHDFDNAIGGASGKSESLLKSFEQIVPYAKQFFGFLASAAKEAAKIAKHVLSFAKTRISIWWDKSAFKNLERAVSRVRRVISSFGRVAFYRAVRSAIKYITDALKEGTENAYHFAKEFGDATHYIADAYDQMSSANFKMSNQLGAAWATLIATIQPIIQQIIALVTRAAQIITQFFALLGGKGTYLKAIDYSKEWADTTKAGAGAAKEWKNQLMGFDEINRLEEPSDGGGGGGSDLPDYSQMFEEAPIEGFMAELRRAIENGGWAQLGKMLGDKFNELVDSVPWSEFGQKLGKGFQAAITTLNFFLNTADFVNLGKRLSEFVNNALANINFTEAGKMYTRLRLVIWEVIYGVVSDLDWGLVATSLSNYVKGALDELARWLQTLDPKEIAEAIKDFISHIDIVGIAESLKEVLKAAFELLSDVIMELIPDDLSKNLGEGLKKAIKGIVENMPDWLIIITGLVSALGIGGLIGVITTLIDLFQVKMFLAVGNFLTALTSINPVAIIVVAAIGAIISIALLLVKHWDEIKEALSRTWQFIEEKAIEYFGGMFDGIRRIWEGIKEYFSGIIDFVAGIFTGNWARAWDGVTSIFTGMYDIVAGTIQSMFGWFNGLISAIADAISWLQGLFDGLNALANSNASRIQADGSIYLTGFASGGFPEDGLFMANHGELVGSFANGKTAVANNEQITAGISEAVYEAFMTAFTQTNGNGGNGQPVNIYLDGRQIAQTTTKYQNQFARASGI